MTFNMKVIKVTKALHPCPPTQGGRANLLGRWVLDRS